MWFYSVCTQLERQCAVTQIHLILILIAAIHCVAYKIGSCYHE